MTTLTLEMSSGDATSKRLSDVLERLVNFVGECADDAPSGAWTVSLLLTDDAHIAELHDRFFDDPSTTDVITFPFEGREDERFGVVEDGHSALSDHLGDIVVSIDTAASNAADIDHPTDREIAFLTLHGLLHLFGYVDDTPERRMAMLARQDDLLKAFERSEPTAWT